MARNRYPEETKNKILKAARCLFYEKGYDNTTIQDIINELGGLTKGVIYHHFKSKQHILECVIESLGEKEEQYNWYDNWQGETGLEKIKYQILNSIQSYERYAILYSAEALLNNPRMLGEAYLSSLHDSAKYLQVYINEGISDGSIRSNYSKELAEFISLTVNLWLGLNISKDSREELINKMHFLQYVFQCINIPIIDNTIINATLKLYDYIQSRK
ncbi:MAG: HTH tetR-type domain-containing protein [Lachnoclostridium sp.]|jgi:AcrR family transcriptional regulator